ncbi:MAG: protein kinase, partial [Ruminococcus sp.]|nr:protein kinase [Ruminococcus sp.]
EPVMRSLKKVHSNGLIHRDISPDNIMLVDGRVKLLDFGAARDVSSMNNKSLSVMLKPGYAPEEQYRSKGNQGPWTDVYALCATMYKCITGVTLDDAPQRVFDDEVKLPSQLGVSIESEVENALVKGIAVLQKDRYQNIDELLNALKIGEKSSVVPTPDSSSKKVAADNLATDYRTYDGSGADFSNRDDVTLDESEIKSTVEEDIPVYSGFASSDVPVYNTTFNQKASNNQAFSVNKAAENNAFNKVNKPSRPKKEKNKKSKKSIGMIAMISVLIVVALVVVITVFSALGNVTIGDKKYSKNEERVRISNATLSEDDVKNICSMGKMETLEMYDCKFEKDAFAQLCEISSPLTGIYFYRCTGIEDYSTLTNLEYIQYLTIDACMITDEQLKKIDFSKFEYLMEVNLSNNIELSDISPLAKMNTLTTLNVTTTKVRDFSSLKDIEVFTSLTADNCGIENIDTLQNKNIVTLCLNNNKLTDISAVERFDILSTFEIHNNNVSDISALKDKAALRYFEAGFNNISDISPLKSSEAMYSLVLNDNNITDISAVSSMQTLFELNINNNQVESLKPLKNAKKLGLLFANENKLSDLDGLEQSIELNRIRVRDNNIENINGIGNCTVLKEVNLKNNNISDISLLSKNAETLEMLFIDNNNVSDISALNGTVNLEYFSFDNNKVKNLDALSSSTNLYAISGENNELTSIDGLKNSTQIVYVFLPHNKIGSMKALSNLGEKENLNGAFIDLSTNNISELDVCNTRTYNYLAVYSNPIKDISPINNAEGNYFLFNYLDDMNLGGFEETFSFYNVIDCPLDKQLEVTEKIKGEDGVETLSFDVLFNTAEEADATIREQRNKIFGISDEKDEIKKTQEIKE